MSSRRIFYDILLERYVGVSTVVSIYMWLSFYSIFKENFLSYALFPTVFLICNIFTYINISGIGTYLKRTIYFPIFFTTQIFSLAGISMTDLGLGGVYLSIIPIAFCIYSVLYEFNISENEKEKHLLVISLLLAATFVALIYWQPKVIWRYEFIFYSSFVFWAFGMIYSGNFFASLEKLSSGNKMLNKFFKGIGNIENINRREKYKLPIVDSNEGRLFFHDLINNTHSISLYLTHKISQNENISAEEAKYILNEVKLMQQLLREFFGHSHKNLNRSNDFLSFRDIKDSVEHLMNNYFSGSSAIKWAIEYKGEYAESFDQQRKYILPTTAFNRILTNLIKNISEVKTDDVKIIFEYGVRGLTLIAKNKVFSLNGENNNSAENLKQLILSKRTNGKIKRNSGIGLESVYSLCNDLRGDFDFFLEGDYWVYIVYLPINQNEDGVNLNIRSDKSELKKAS